MKKIKYPKIGVALIYLNENKEILCCYRTKDNSWGLVGGKVDYGETFEETAIRESLEEANLKPTKLEYLGINEAIDKDKAKHHITVFYLVKEYVGKFKNNEPEKHKDWKYFNIENLSEALFFPLKSALPKIKEYLKNN